jgi:hypothetical protein
MKRTTFLLLAASVLAVVAMQSWGAPAPNAEQRGMASKAVLLDRLKPGQAVTLDDKQGRYEIGILPENIRPLSHSVIEVGQDYVVLRDLVGVTDRFVPIYSIHCIRVLRVGGK